MSFQVEGQGGQIMQVDGSHLAARMSVLPLDHASYGHYSVSGFTGSIAATLAASSPLFAFRWADASVLAVVYNIEVSMVINGTITTAVANAFEALIATSWTSNDSGTGSTTLTPNKMRTSGMGTSVLTEARLAGAVTLTAGTRTLNTNAFGLAMVHTGTTAGASPSPLNKVPLFRLDIPAAHPLVLGQNQGFIIRNAYTGPATGTFILGVQVNWAEVATFDNTQRG